MFYELFSKSNFFHKFSVINTLDAVLNKNEFKDEGEMIMFK